MFIEQSKYSINSIQQSVIDIYRTWEMVYRSRRTCN